MNQRQINDLLDCFQACEDSCAIQRRSGRAGIPRCRSDTLFEKGLTVRSPNAKLYQIFVRTAPPPRASRNSGSGRRDLVNKISRGSPQRCRLGPNQSTTSYKAARSAPSLTARSSPSAAEARESSARKSSAREALILLREQAQPSLTCRAGRTLKPSRDLPSACADRPTANSARQKAKVAPIAVVRRG